jgi:adenine/guanine phosphoribosyltransferase-like PRPP-binding protein/uncharacterized HAD superfamily protein
MACPVTPGPVRIVKDFARDRLAKCKECIYAKGDTCELVEIKHPGHSSIEHGVIRKELRCPKPEPEWIEQPQECPRCKRPRQIITTKSKVCHWCQTKLAVSGQTWNPEQTKAKSKDAFITRGFKPRGSAFRETFEPQWVSLQQLTHDVQTLVAAVPDDIRVVVGVARSGITPASMLASLLHLPLLSIRQTKGDIIEVGNGWRLGGSAHIEAEGRAIIVDDTVMTGNSLNAIARIVGKRFKDPVTAAIYVNPLAKTKPDIYVRDLSWPHLLEWNLFNSVLSPNMACDFDGILCHDCPRGSDDDGERYLDFIRNARPLYIARKVPIPLIVTARLEKYREPTMAWLKRYGIRVHQLIMHSAATLHERNQDDIAAYKARHFEAWASQHFARPAPLAFIESEDRQAKRIAEITGRMVVCPSSHSVYPFGLNYSREEIIKDGA